MKVAKLSAVAVAVAVVLVTVSAYAGDRLLPTDMLEPGRFFSEFGYSYSMTEGELVLGTVKADIKGEEHRISVALGFGLSDGVDVEIRSGYIATGSSDLEADFLGSHVEMESYTEGIEDTDFRLRFRIADERTSGADAVFALIGIFPSGYRKDGQGEVKINGALVQDGKRDYPGDGVISYGAGFAVSGTSGNIKPYMVCSYVFGGRRKRHDVKEHYSDEATLQLGFQVHTAHHAKFDFSLMAVQNSPSTTESHGARSREADFLMGGAAFGMYFEFAPDATFMIGIMYVMIEGHQIDRDTGDKIEDAFGIIPMIGLHILF